jgi:AcrR family transcriptional regulator
LLALRENEERAMATKPKNDAKPASPDLRGKIVDALMELAAERRFEDISVRDICKQAGVTLADFRDFFPSKGAALAGFSRRIDRVVLAEDSGELADESPRERLFDILMRRLEALAPYREGVREAGAWLRREPAAALAMNQVATSSMRFMLEAAGIEAEGAAGLIKVQGLALAWARVLRVWLDDEDPALSKTMAELDRVLTRGEQAAAGVDRLSALATPFATLAQAVFEAGRSARKREARPAAKDDSGDEGATVV